MKRIAILVLLGCDDSPKTAQVPSSPPVTNQASVDLGAKVFQRCSPCHTIGGGDTTGPDLAGVTERRDEAWLARWMEDPVGMGKTDPVGIELLKKFVTPMPPQNLSQAEHDEVFRYIADH